jgi:N-acetylglucosamine-6-phosphate deacetylase
LVAERGDGSPKTERSRALISTWHLPFKNAVTLVGISLDDALRAESLVPARFLGIEQHRGTLSAGARADIVALTTNLDVLTTWLAGKQSE